MISRRALLGAVGAVVVAGAAGAGVATVVPERRQMPRPAAVPQPLQQALDRELLLISALDAALRRQDAPALRVVRADHAAHAAALSSAIGAPPSPSPSSSATPPPAAAPTVAQLRASEHDAARTAAAESAGLTGADAALLASISACEATHAELLA